MENMQKTQNLNLSQKTLVKAQKPWFSRLLQHPERKHSGSIGKG